MGLMSWSNLQERIAAQRGQQRLKESVWRSLTLLEAPPPPPPPPPDEPPPTPSRAPMSPRFLFAPRGAKLCLFFSPSQLPMAQPPRSRPPKLEAPVAAWLKSNPCDCCALHWLQAFWQVGRLEAEPQLEPPPRPSKAGISPKFLFSPRGVKLCKAPACWVAKRLTIAVMESRMMSSGDKE